MQTSGFHALTLMEKSREHGEVYSFLFRPEVPFAYVPGQYVHLLAPQSPPGRENVRHLSIASHPSEEVLRFTMDLGSGSDYKKKFRALEPGGKAHLFKVKGEFVLGSPPPDQAVFVAGGLGITPIRALLEQIHRESLPVDYRLVHVARSEHLFAEELSRLGGVQTRVDRPGLGPVLDAWTKECPEARWFVAGSHRFVEGACEALLTRGLSANRIRTEDFE